MIHGSRGRVCVRVAMRWCLLRTRILAAVGSVGLGPATDPRTMRVGVTIVLSMVIGSIGICRAEGSPAPTVWAEFEAQVGPFLKAYCVKCHGEEKQKADFVLHDIDGVVTAGKDTVRWEKILEMLSLADMPPEKERQPSRLDRKRVTTWIAVELAKIGRGQDAGKLALPHQANRIDHEELFSGEHVGPGWSPARLWRKSPEIYARFSAEMRTQVSQPFLGLGGKGIQDYASLYADESTIKTMMRNSNLIAANLLTGEKARLGYLFKTGKEGEDELIERGVRDLFRMIFQREATAEDQSRYVDGLFKKNYELGGLEVGFRTLIMGMLMSQEFVFRQEVGLGKELSDGRRKLAPLEIAYALSFAFYDQPSKPLLEAAQAGKLATKGDVEREVRRILGESDERKRYWNYPMYHQWGGDYYQHRPRVLRFFQEFFGYPAVVDAFKDKERNGDHHALRLRKDADLFVLHILEQDREVLKKLLTSNEYPMDYFKEDKMAKLLTGKNEKQLKHYQERYGEEFAAIAKSGKWPGIDTRHVSAYNLDRKATARIRRSPGELVVLPKKERAGMLTHPAWLVAHSGNFDNDPIRRGKWIREHLLADVIPDVPIGVDAKVPEDPHRTLRERMEIVRKAECWRCHKKMNPLGMPFESYDDFGRFRERIVLGDADAYFKAKRKYEHDVERAEEDLKKWIKWDAPGRVAKVVEAEEHLAALVKPKEEVENYSAQLRRYEGDLKRWTKERETWSKLTDEEQERRIAGLKRRLSELKPPVAEAKPVEARGELRGTGDAALDGEVKDAIELADRLGRSERVRQSLVRHAFRFWMGRNETLNDSPTLMAADEAYVKGGGSFKELLVALLTSDSFLYRR